MFGVRAGELSLTGISNFQITRWSAVVCTALAILSAITFMFAQRLPQPRSRPEIREEPLQTALAVSSQSFNLELRGHTYSITPRFNYHLTGLVVSKSDAMGWQNITHKSAGDFLNTNDLCVVWGANAETLPLHEFKFTHGDWTCYVSTDTDVWRSFKMDGLANNHVLPSTPELAAQFRSVNIGDQIEINGQLVDYSIDGHPARTTSLVRTDTGNGACEIIYVTRFRFIERHHVLLYRVSHLAAVGAGLSFLMLLVSLFVLPFVRTHE